MNVGDIIEINQLVQAPDDEWWFAMIAHRGRGGDWDDDFSQPVWIWPGAVFITPFAYRVKKIEKKPASTLPPEWLAHLRGETA